ncbi:trigger factor [Thermovirga sp.]|uniref:trigger factor n=1 Tax=Thermovirga sp. TaxID=2699834 RepID=UPI0025D654EF|nr:trigger factor [Thermovirga sp.]MBO8153191.1 trigger factor [Thermovirga sp.]
MRSEIISQEKNVVKIQAQVSQEDFKKSFEEAINELRKKANIKGFRKGRVPRNVLLLHLGKEAIQSEALEKLIPEMLDKIVEDYGLDLIDRPKVEIDEIKDGEPLNLTFTFETRPEVELPEIEELEVEREVVEVNDELIDKAVEEIRFSFSEKEQVEGRPAKEGDIVEINYTVKVEGNDESQEPQKTTVELSPSTLRKEFLDALLGKEVGDKVDVELEVPKEKENKSGDEVSNAEETERVGYSIEILSIFEKKLPEVGADLFAKVFGEDVQDEDTFRQKIKETLEKRFSDESWEAAKERAVELICDKSSVELPETLIKRQMEELRNEDVNMVQKRFGKSWEEYAKEVNLNEEEYNENLRKYAEKLVKRTLVLEAMAEKEGISVEREDLQQEIAKLAQSVNADPERVQQVLAHDKERLSNIIGKIRFEKTVNNLMNRIKIKEVSVSKKENEGNSAEEN